MGDKAIFYTLEDLTEALRAINSIIYKCEKAQEKFLEGNSHHTLLRNRLKAIYISKELLTDKIAAMSSELKSPPIQVNEYSAEVLLSHLDLLHTTDLGAARIKKNLRLHTDDIVAWCKAQMKVPNAVITRKGKNWYVVVQGIEITVNAHCYTVITAHFNLQK